MKIAAFVNLENVLHPEWLKSNLEKLEGIECYFSEKGNFDLNTLFTGVNTCYQDYDYVLLLHAPERGEHEPLQFYVSRQNYYLNGLISSKDTFRQTIELLEKDHRIGAVTLPLDFLQVENWENYEKWSDYYYLISRWIKQNELRVSINKDKPPIINCPMAVIRTKAIRGIEKLDYKVYSASFLAYTISLYCQSKGFLPHYAVPRSMLINNYLGFEDFTSLHKDMLKTKQEYYRQNEAYKKSHMEWQEKRIESLEDQLSVLERLRSSVLWRITAPLRAMVKMICRRQ